MWTLHAVSQIINFGEHINIVTGTKPLKSLKNSRPTSAEELPRKIS